MKQKQTGFSVVEILVVVVVVGLLGAIGWFMYARQKAPAANTSTTQEASKPAAKKTAPYSFKELGVSMDVLDGWEVKSAPTKQEGVNFYTWTVAKAGADGKIVLVSAGFRGGFEECMSTPATIKEVTPTNNPKLLFMSWSYVYDNTTNYRTGIVKADEAVFKTTDSEAATPIKNSETKAGDYYFCLGYPPPGFSLDLNSESAPGFSRKDSISAHAAAGDDFLSPSAQSYSDIKTMLRSVK